MFRLNPCNVLTLPVSRLSLQTFRHLATRNHYQTLGLKASASSDDIRKAFLRLSKELHPDVNIDDSQSHEKFVRINEAYMVLSKSLSRQAYDNSITARSYHNQHERLAKYRSDMYKGKYRENYREGFWDETIWYMRDREKDSYGNKPYYGIKGVKKVPNSYIVAVCICFMTIGAMLHYLALVNSRGIYDKDVNDGVANVMHNERYRGLQIELMKSEIRKKAAIKKELNDER